MQLLRSHHIACPAGQGAGRAHLLQRPLAPWTARAPGAGPCLRADRREVQQRANGDRLRARSGPSNGAAAAPETVYVPVSELRDLCTQSLAALGYNSDEINTLSDVSRGDIYRPGSLLQHRSRA